MDQGLIHSKQFFLSKERSILEIFSGWNSFEFSNRTLCCHPQLNVSIGNSDENSLILLGNIYDYRFPEKDNQELAYALIESDTFNDLLDAYSHTSGESVLLIRWGGKSYILNDACAQMEVYYTRDFSHFASQPKLLEKLTPLIDDNSSVAQSHYRSQHFRRKQTLVGKSTPYQNVGHLGANHYLNLLAKKMVRFYPNRELTTISISEAANILKKQLTGFLSAASIRRKLVLPITAGIDSRVILTCALEAQLENIEFFVIHAPWMKDDHPDLVISQMIADKLNLELRKMTINEDMVSDIESLFDQSLSYHDRKFNAISRDVFQLLESENKTIVDGSIIGVVKNFFGRLVNVTAKDLSRIAGYDDSAYAITNYQEWLTNSKHVFKKYGFHLLDMFFWEDRAANWAAKGKSKFLMISDHYSIFNSRALFENLLSTKRKYRDAQHQFVFNKILTDSTIPLHFIPINPTHRKKTILLLKKLKLYWIYRNLAIKLGLLKFK